MSNFDGEKALYGRKIDGELDQIRNPTPMPIFRKGVVWDFIPSPLSVTDALVERLVEQGGSEEALRSAPPNSIVLIPVDYGMAHHLDRLIVCYPFFSHLELPAKPGELVWFTSGSEGMPGSTNSHWWLSRVVSSRTSEDRNYTHYFRDYWSRDERGYPNGAGSESSSILPGGIDAFDRIVEESSAAGEFRPDAAARPNSSVNASGISGSHNNRIWFDATEEGGTVEIAAAIPKPKSRKTTRGWDEYDHASDQNRSDLLLPGIVNSSGAKITLFERKADICEDLRKSRSPSAGERAWDVDWSSDFAGKQLWRSLDASASIWAKDTLHLYGGKALRFRGQDSDIALQRGQIAISTDNLLVDSDRIILLRNEEDRLYIGGDEPSEALVLGSTLREWQEELLSTLEDFITAIESAILPTSMGPAPFRNAFGTSDGTLPNSAQTARRRLSALRDAIPSHLSDMAFINKSNQGDSED